MDNYTIVALGCSNRIIAISAVDGDGSRSFLLPVKNILYIELHEDTLNITMINNNIVSFKCGKPFKPVETIKKMQEFLYRDSRRSKIFVQYLFIF